MKYVILDITAWTGTVPRVAILKEIYSDFESKFYLFPFINNMISAHSVNDELTQLTGFSVLLKAANGIPLNQLTTGMMLVFPF